MNFAVEFKNIGKSYNGFAANSKVNLKVRDQTIHAIIGENGAGKSTAMKILYGMVRPDEGEICLHGVPWGQKGRPWTSPSEAIQAGIGMVHQHFMLGEPQTVFENIILGVEPTKGRAYFPAQGMQPFLPIDKKKAREKILKICERYGMPLDLNARVKDLSVGIHQRIEIIKTLYRDAKILIMDEPTAVLTPMETAELLDQLRRLRTEGKTIILITHKLKEVKAVADDVSVLRAGTVVGERKMSEVNEEDLAELMVGRKIDLDHPYKAAVEVGASVLKVRDLSVQARCSLKKLNFEVRAGEVVGVAGVEGNGQTELLNTLLHPNHQFDLSGSIELFGRDVSKERAATIKKLGVGFIPEDRHKDGLLLDCPLYENFSLGLHRRAPFSWKSRYSESRSRRETQKAIDEFRIHGATVDGLAKELSGGNQQKLIVAREFYFDPKFLIAAQPTRGVDIGAIEFIHKKILHAREKGCAILLVSSELDEILALSDRILVLYEGEIIEQLSRNDANEKNLGLRMGGAKEL